MRKPIRLEGGPLELDGTEVPDTCQVVVIMDDAEFVPHKYWVIHRWPEEVWVGEYRGIHDASSR